MSQLRRVLAAECASNVMEELGKCQERVRVLEALLAQQSARAISESRCVEPISASPETGLNFAAGTMVQGEVL